MSDNMKMPGEGHGTNANGIVAEKRQRKDWSDDEIGTGELIERTTRRYYIPGIIQEKNHVVLFGNSGTGKTTIGFFLMKKIIDENPGVTIMYFLLDGADQIALNARNFIPDKNLKIIMNKNAQDIMNDLSLEVKDGVDLRETIYVFDTYKKFQNDVNNKKANTQHLDLVRKVTALGATCISIAHTNKDGVTFSGNAEIEQDTDGVVGFDRLLDAENKEMMTVSLTEGARVRWKFEECSFRMPSSDPDPAKVESIEYMDISKWQGEKEDTKAIETIKNSIREMQKTERHIAGIQQQDLVNHLTKHEMMAINAARDLLIKYSDRHWQRKMIKGVGAKSYRYSVFSE